jgi:hypothetical protein
MIGNVRLAGTGSSWRWGEWIRIVAGRPPHACGPEACIVTVCDDHLGLVERLHMAMTQARLLHMEEYALGEHRWLGGGRAL